MFENIDYLMLSPSGKCNLNCFGCNRNNSKSINLSPNILHKVFELFPNIKFVKLQGMGEPFIGNLYSICKEIKEKYENCNIMTITNGTMNYSIRKNVFKYLDELYISANDIKYIDIIINNIRKIIEFYPIENLRINLTILENNINNLSEIISKLIEFDDRLQIRIQHYQDWSDVSKINDLSNKINYSIFQYSNIKYIGRDDFDDSKCLWHSNRVQVDEYGNIRLCCLKTENSIICNINDISEYNKNLILRKTQLCNTCSFKLLNNINNNIIGKI